MDIAPVSALPFQRASIEHRFLRCVLPAHLFQSCAEISSIIIASATAQDSNPVVRQQAQEKLNELH